LFEPLSPAELRSLPVLRSLPGFRSLGGLGSPAVSSPAPVPVCPLLRCVASCRTPAATSAATLRWRSPSPLPAIVDAEAGSSSVRNRDQKDSVAAEGEGCGGASVTLYATSWLVSSFDPTGFSAGSGGDHAVWIAFVALGAEDGTGATSAGRVGCAFMRAATRSCKPA
jgi:hypothetical protein